MSTISIKEGFLKVICNTLLELNDTQKELLYQLLFTSARHLMTYKGMNDTEERLMLISNLIGGCYKEIKEHDISGQYNIHYCHMNNIYDKTFIYYNGGWFWGSAGEMVENNWGIYE